MGVPVVSLIGDRHAARVGLSILSAAGVDRFAAENEDRYLQIAVELSRDLRGLSDIRSTLRAKLRASPLCDRERFARDFEAALRQMLQA
jgi:protein O-GlcNAc transferase